MLCFHSATANEKAVVVNLCNYLTIYENVWFFFFFFQGSDHGVDTLFHRDNMDS